MAITSSLNFENGPFSKNVPVDKLYTNDNREDILARLTYTAAHHGFAILTAPPGSGKSTLLRRLAATLDPTKYIFIYISDSNLSPKWLYNDILAQLGLPLFNYRGDGRKMVQSQIDLIESNTGKHLVVCIDEAHLLAKDTIEEIRFLLNTNMDSASPLALILAGQEELKTRLRDSRFNAVRQRIDMVCSVNALDGIELKTYIQKHLDLIEESVDDLFAPEAIQRIFERSRGVPRTVNTICGKALLHASMTGASIITDSIVKGVIDTELF